MKQWNDPLVWSLFVIFLVTVVFTRYHALDYAPAGSDGDTAWIALDAAALVDRGVIPHYVDPLHSPDPIIVYLIGLSKVVFGATIYTPRIVTATASIITALLMLPMMWELLPEKSPRYRLLAGVLAMGAAATSMHAMNISRLGHDSPILPVVVALTIWMTAAAWFRGGWWRWVLAGLFLASTQYVYLTGRMMGLVPPAWLLYTLLANRKRFNMQFSGWVVMGLVAFLLVLPNLIMFVTLPESFSGRVDSDIRGSTGLIWEADLARHGGLFNFLQQKLWLMFRSTGIEWHDPLLPMSTPIFTPIFFVGWMVGIGVALRRVHKVGYGLLLIAMPLLLLGDLITSTELNPTPMRQTQVLPIYYALSGIGLLAVWQWIEKHLEARLRRVIAAVALIVALLPTALMYHHYITVDVAGHYANPETAWRISQTDIDISDRINAQADQSYLLPYGEYTRKTIAWLTLAGFGDRHSALAADGSLNIPNPPENVMVVEATDPNRARLDTAVGLNYSGWWVLLHEGQTILLPPLDLDKQALLRDAITREADELIIDASEQAVASLYNTTLPDDFFTVPDFIPVDALIGKSQDNPEVRLVGYNIFPTDTIADQAIRVSLYWQPLQRLRENYEIFVQLWDDDATVYAESHELPYEGTYRSRVWYPDEITVTHHVLFTQGDFSPGRYSLGINFYRILENERLGVSGKDAGSSGDVVLLDDFRVAPEQDSLSLPQIEQRIQFGDYISIERAEIRGTDDSHDLFGEWVIEQGAGASLTLALEMDVVDDLPLDYSYFLHVIPTEGEQPVAQSDQALGQFGLPAGAWRIGDTWFEQATVTIPEGLERGEYDVWLGVYYYADGSRLPVRLDEELQPDNRVRIGQIIIQ